MKPVPGANDNAYREREPDDDVPDARDGLTRKERIVLQVLSEAQEERGDRSVPMVMLYGRVVEKVDVSPAELMEIVKRLTGRAPAT